MSATMPAEAAAPPGRYVAAARWLHWTMALLILLVATLGVWIGFFEPADEALKLRLYNFHESLGVTVFLLALWRLGVRWTNPPPKLPPGTPAVVHAAAAVSHFGLYALMLLMPVIGFLATNAWGFPLSWFGVLPLPSPIGKNESLAPLLSTLHWVGALLLGAIVAAHVLGTIYHVKIRRDGLLDRMT